MRSLGNFRWVATIRMSGHELLQSHHKASIIIGLAVDAIGLRFHVEDARRFTKAGRQHLYFENRLATSPEGALLGGSSVQVPGLGGKPGALAAKMAAERPFLDAAGKVLDAYVRDARPVAHPTSSSDGQTLCTGSARPVEKHRTSWPS